LAQDRDLLAQIPVEQRPLKTSVILVGLRGFALPEGAFVASVRSCGPRGE